MHSPTFYTKPNPTPVALALAPLGWLYGMTARWHGAQRAARAYYASVPVIAVGNLVAGGSGKTPLVAALANHYAAMGTQVAIVLRGYGGRESALPLQVTFQHTAKQVGDEAAMLYAMLPTSVQVWVGRHRPSVVRRAEQAGAGLVILDDAFQRRDVARQANILVMYGPYPFGNGLCLPAGPLREPMEGVARADFAIHFGAPTTPAHEAPPYYGTTTYRLNTVPDAAAIETLKGKPLMAFAGIGYPDKFFKTLRDANLNVVHTVPLPDHVHYTPTLMHQLQSEARARNATLVTTAKDAIKLSQGFAQVLPVTIGGTDWENVLAALEDLLS